MPDVQVNQDPLVVFAIVAAIGVLALIGVIFALIGGRILRPPTG